MRKRQTGIALGLLGLTISAGVGVACTSGAGPYLPYDDSYDRPPDTRDKPGDTRQTPTGAVDNPGSQGGGPSSSGGGANGCPPCDGTFKCTVVVQGQTVSQNVELRNVGGQCVSYSSRGKPNGGLACGGAVLDDDGKTTGAWTADGANGFTVTGTATIGNTKTTITEPCTRVSSSTAPVPANRVMRLRALHNTASPDGPLPRSGSYGKFCV